MMQCGINIGVSFLTGIRTHQVNNAKSGVRILIREIYTWCIFSALPCVPLCFVFVLVMPALSKVPHELNISFFPHFAGECPAVDWDSRRQVKWSLVYHCKRASRVCVLSVTCCVSSFWRDPREARRGACRWREGRCRSGGGRAFTRVGLWRYLCGLQSFRGGCRLHKWVSVVSLSGAYLILFGPRPKWVALWESMRFSQWLRRVLSVT